MAKQFKRSGLTLVELMVTLMAVGILLCFFLPACEETRGPARRTMCMINLKQWSLAALNFESVHMKLPMGVGVEDQEGVLQTQPLSGFVSLLPFIEGTTLYDQIARPTAIDGLEYPAFGPVLSNSDYAPWTSEVECLICPSAEPIKTKFGRTCYAFSIGDVARNVNQQQTLRGVFGYFKSNRISDILDGTSNTVGIIEIGGGNRRSVKGGCLRDGKAAWLDDPQQVFTVIESGDYPASEKTIGRGTHWADGRAGVGLASTILPPKSPSFQVQGSPTDDGIYSAGSMHTGGVNVAFVDGSTHFILENIDTGDSSAPTLSIEQMEAGHASPHGVWGALGTIGSGEIVDFY